MFGATRSWAAPTSVSRRYIWLGAVVIVVATLAAHYGSLSGALVLDDLTSVTTNPSIRHLWPLAPMLTPPADSGVGGRPFANLTFAINYALGGTDARGYHALNLALHVLSALVLFGIVRRTIGTRSAPTSEPSLMSRCDERGSFVIGLAVAGLWAVHPLTTAAVAYVSQRTEVLMTLCYLLTLYAFIRGVRESRRAWLVISVVVCALGMASKEVMATAPLVVLFYDRTFVAGSWAETWRRRRGYYASLAATWLLLVGLMTTGLSQRGVGFGLGVSGWNYALTECEAVSTYLARAFWPHPLVFDYGPVFIKEIGDAVPFAFGVLMLLAGAVVALWRAPGLGFLAAFFFIALAPTSSVVPVAVQPIAENRAYLALIAIVALTVWGSVALLGRRAAWIGSALGLSFVLLAAQRTADYRSEIGLWTDSLAKRPQNPRGHNNLGLFLFQAGDAARAIPHYEAALRLNTNYPEAENNLANALLKLGRASEAVLHYRHAVEIKPDYATAWTNLGTALLQLDKTDEVLGLYEDLARRYPKSSTIQNNYGVVLRRLGRIEDAIKHYERAAQLDPTEVDTPYNLGNALVELGRLDDAVRQFERALHLQPDYAAAHYNLGNVFFRLGNLPGAIAHFEQALRLQGDSAEAHNNYGSALYQSGRITEAITQFEHALRLQPDYAVARANLARARGAASSPK